MQPCWRVFSWGLACACLLLSTVAHAADDDDEPEFVPGLVARYRATNDAQQTRLDAQIAFAWKGATPDPRVLAGQFSARWQGNVLIQSPGAYRFKAFAQGSVRLVVAGQTLLDEEAAAPRWLDSAAIDLEFGYLPLEVEYRGGGSESRLALYWSGPQFQTEPLAARWLFHPAGEKVDGSFERGQLLARALRCAACHDVPGESQPLAGPALDKLAGNVSSAWLIDWLTTAGHEVVQHETEETDFERVPRRMPSFGLSPDDAQAVAAYLTGGSAQKAPEKKDAVNDVPQVAGDATSGATLFRTVGCLACHRVGELGADGLFGGGNLSHVADKRPADYFAVWLTAPAKMNRQHRMPVYSLKPQETADLAAYLQTLHDAKKKNEPLQQAAKSNTDAERKQGEKLFEQHRCAACHASSEKKGNEKEPKLKKDLVTRLPLKLDWSRSCTEAPQLAKQQPGYALSGVQRLAIKTYVDAMSFAPVVKSMKQSPANSLNGAQVIIERNCLSCHARGDSRGLAPRLDVVAEADASLREQMPAMTPPALFDIGDKLSDAALTAAITTSQKPRRPWLHVRMPRFPLSDEEKSAVTRYLIDVDRIPDLPLNEKPELDATAAKAAGARLVTADGFGCTSCHAIGQWIPQKVALNALGPDLAGLGSRIRRPWYDRWMSNPARIVPRMEMPAVKAAARGVLDGHLGRQLSAVWLALNEPGFTPPAPGALRVVRSLNSGDENERAHVLTDTIEIDGRPFVKPLIIGLPNRHNVLFDLATNRLSAWWIGDTARQRTRAKSWYWESAGEQLWPKPNADAPDAGSDIWLEGFGEKLQPVSTGQFPTEFDWIDHRGGGVGFGHRLHFNTRAEGGPKPVRVEQRFFPRSPSMHFPEQGFQRLISVKDVPPGYTVQLRVSPGSAKEARWKVIDVDREQYNIATARVNQAERVLALMTLEDKRAVANLSYETAETPVAAAAPAAEQERLVAQATLHVVPGFDAVRLATPERVMPTGFAWGSGVFVSSLEGRVWHGRDTNGDGLIDKMTPFSDDLAAPYGIAVHETNIAGGTDAIDVITKHALVRLEDTNRHDRADRMTTLASGWGHTLDYHDWAVGLPRGADGEYYVALPCQQDDRSEAAANLRGTLIKLTPPAEKASEATRYKIEEICAGLRFPMGIALSRAGEIFTSDNQGNYTPFNELNHIVPGARYGFINRLEVKRGLNPPHQSAAIEIPHPWTRSVNGICFLEAPAHANRSAKSAANYFGPFTGHLVGCEYDSRRLVRMSLEKVQGQYQGAVYPLSREPIAGEETFEGPLVCQVAPNGDLYVGNIRDSGWGAGSNTGSIVRMRWNGILPIGIAEVRATQRGFSIDFTGPVDRDKATAASNYGLSSYRRAPTPAYGGADQDRRAEKIKAVSLSDDRRRAILELDSLREGFVYELQVRELVDGQRMFPTEAFYTLRHIPRGSGDPPVIGRPATKKRTAEKLNVIE